MMFVCWLVEVGGAGVCELMRVSQAGSMVSCRGVARPG